LSPPFACIDSVDSRASSSHSLVTVYYECIYIRLGLLPEIVNIMACFWDYSLLIDIFPLRLKETSLPPYFEKKKARFHDIVYFTIQDNELNV